MKNNNVFIGNLDFSTTEEEVKTLLSNYGTVVNIKMHKKKGCAFIEMSDEAEAAQAIEKLNGTMFKDREVRISLEMKAKKAKALSIKKYNERMDRSAPHGSADSPGPRKKDWSHDRPSYTGRHPRDENKSGHGRSPRPETDYNSRGRFSGSDDRPVRNYSRARSDSPHPKRKEWSHDKPSYSGGHSRDEHTSGHGRSPEQETNYNTRERFPYADARPVRNYSRERSDSQHPRRKEWSHDKPSYSGRHSRDEHASGHGRSTSPETNYNTRERFPDTDDRPVRNYSRERSDSSHPRRKEWSHDRPSYSGRPSRDEHKSGHGRSTKPETNYNTRERYPDTDDRPVRNYSRGRSDSTHPRRKEWSHDRPSYAGRPSGPGRQSGAGTRDHSKPRPAGGSQDRFSTSSRPKSGSGGRNSSAKSAKPGARGGTGNRNRNSRPRRD